MSHHISNERMSAFLDTIYEQVRETLHERADDMLKAWHENIEEAQANEKNFPPLKVGSPHLSILKPTRSKPSSGSRPLTKHQSPPPSPIRTSRKFQESNNKNKRS